MHQEIMGFDCSQYPGYDRALRRHKTPKRNEPRDSALCLKYEIIFGFAVLIMANGQNKLS
jgi:hypothetical protein